MKELKLTVPTYNGDFYWEDVENGLKPEFGRPNVRAVVRREAGLRIVLGTHNSNDLDKPDLKIERHPNGWLIILHPLGGTDPCAAVFFADDGRSFFMKESDLSPTPSIQIVEPDEPGPAIYAGDRTAMVQARRKCARCRQTKELSDDWHLDLCPACADNTDGNWGCVRCGRCGTFEAMHGDGSHDPVCCGLTCRYVGY
jgi:hypothetical protein